MRIGRQFFFKDCFKWVGENPDAKKEKIQDRELKILGITNVSLFLPAQSKRTSFLRLKQCKVGPNVEIVSGQMA